MELPINRLQNVPKSWTSINLSQSGFRQLKSIQCTTLVHSGEAMHKKQENLCKEWPSVKSEVPQIVNLFWEKVLNPEPLLTPRKVNHYRYL